MLVQCRIPQRFVLAVCVLGAVRSAALGYEPPFTMNSVDEEACATFHDGKKTEMDEIGMLAALGFPKLEGAWSAGTVSKAWTNETFQYRLAFARPIEAGSVMLSAGSIAILKENAAYPGDPAAEEQWTKPPVPPNQSGACLVPLPPRTKIRSLLITDVRNNGRSQVSFLRLFPERLHNITPLALPNAESEYTLYPSMGPPHTYAAADVIRGSGSWVNCGKNKLGQNLRPPVSDIHPSWFVLSWKVRQQVVGLWLSDSFQVVQFYQFVGPDSVNPAVGTEQEWKKIEAKQESAGGRWVRFAPIATRGVKLLILKTTDPQVAVIHGMHVFTDLGDGPVPPTRPAVATEVEPYRIPYSLPDDGVFTMAVDSPDGRRMRNIVARAERSKGDNAEYWDLKTEDDEFVQPGTYTWKAIVNKPLQLRYEMTAYPNIETNTSENSPWLNGASGPGGWMADHTPPRAVCTFGDRVYFGATCAESGVSFIECDLTGKKLWGYHSFAAWTGPQYLTTDGRNVYVAAGGGDTDNLWAVDIESKKVSNVASYRATSLRQRGVRGIAATPASPGKLYVSVDGGSAWLANAAGGADVDIEACTPRYPVKRPPRHDYEIVPDPRNDFMRLFRLQGTPPGYVALSWLQSTEGPAGSQHIVLAFNREVPLGSVVYPVPQDAPHSVKLSFLNRDADWPPNPEKQSEWTPFEENGKHPWDAIAAPPNTQTRALRISFSRGADDVFSQIEDEKVSGAGVDNLVDAKDEVAGSKGAWMGQLEGMKLLRRRFTNITPSAQIKVNTGKVEKDGSWDAEREVNRPVTADDPGIYALVWDKPQEIRGLAIMEIDGKTTEIDVYTGPDGPPVRIESNDNWKKVATYEQALREYYPSDTANPKARYMDGYVDLGDAVKTRAVRLRVVDQHAAPPAQRPLGVREDRGGTTLDPTRCRVYGVVALHYVGGEPPVDPLICERIEAIDVEKQKIDREVYVRKAGEVAFNAKGELHAISENRIVKIDMEGGRHKAVVSDLTSPVCLTFDQAGNLYVFDAAPERKVVRVYDPHGKYLRDIGTPGGYRAGPWEGTRFDNVTQIAIDKQNQLYAVEYGYWPKRITQWSLDGKLKREFLGNTCYGGGGVLDPYDKTRLFYGSLEFELNWDTGRTRLKNLTWLGWDSPEVPVEVNGRRYMTTRACWTSQQCGIVYLYEKDHVKRAAAMGLASAFAPLQQPEIRKMCGNKGLSDFKFIWTDRSGDGEVQAAEVVLAPRGSTGGVGAVFNRDLSVQGSQSRYEVKEFLPTGVPVYEERPMPGLPQGQLMRFDNGNFCQMDAGPKRYDLGLAPDGKTLWGYKTEGSGGHAYFGAKPLYPAQVVSELGWIGHETAHAGDLGEFVVTHTNTGIWHIWTSDGLLAGRIFRDLRDPKCWAWSMKEHDRGMALDELTAGNEHFQGYFCRSLKDNKYYVVAGHNHASVVEVIGLDKFKRLTGEFTITAKDLEKARAWELEQQNKKVYEKACVIDCFRRKMEPRIDANVDDWDTVSAEIGDGAKFRVNYDDTYLYLCYESGGLGPMKNSGEQWDRLFKTGASVDLQMGLDPAADAGRKAAVRGDFRLLMTMMGREPTAVIYRPVVPGTPADKVWHVVSPVNRAAFDDVHILREAKMACRSWESGYIFEAAIPLKAIGLVIKPNLRLKLDWGVLVSGKDGNEVLRRIYWSNKATSIVADAPSEAVLHPDLWGNVRFHERDASQPEASEAAPEIEDDKTATRFLDDLKEDLK